MNALDESILLAKLTWNDPTSGEGMELVLPEGASISIGRLDNNDICIKEQHVSRQHATVVYQDGMFVITDQGSANGVFVNDERLTAPFPLTAGDVIRLYVPLIQFAALVEEEVPQTVAPDGKPTTSTGVVMGSRLIVTGGPKANSTIPLRATSATIGRATSSADWEIAIPDPSISRPHARIDKIDNNWVIYDLGSANGTLVNNTPVNEKGRVLRDNDVITMGSTIAQFRSA